MIKDDQEMFIALVVSEEKVLTVGSIDLFPVGERILYSGNRGMFKNLIFDVQIFQDILYLFSVCHDVTILNGSGNLTEANVPEKSNKNDKSFHQNQNIYSDR